MSFICLISLTNLISHIKLILQLTGFNVCGQYYFPCCLIPLRCQPKLTSKTIPIMNQAVVISTRVLATINSLPDEERSAMAAALTGEFILGMDVSKELTEMQQIVYRIIRNYVVSDMRRAAN